MDFEKSNNAIVEASQPPGPIIPLFGGIPVIRILNFLALIMTFTVYGLSSRVLINNVAMDQILNELPTYFVVSNAALFILGFTSLFLAVWGIYQILPRSYNNAAINEGIGYLGLFSAITNNAWVIVILYRYNALSVILLSGTLASNIIIYLRLKRWYQAKTWTDTLCVHTGWSLYTAWVLGSSLINLWAAATEVDPFYIDETICALVILCAVKIGLTVKFKDPLVVFVGAWFIRINYIEQQRVERLGIASIVLSIILVVVGVVVSLSNIVKIFRARRKRNQSQSNV